MVPFPATLSHSTYISRSRSYHRCPRRIACTAYARSVCDSWVLVFKTQTITRYCCYGNCAAAVF